MHVSFISSRDTGETRIYYVWSDNVSIMQGKDTDDINRNFQFFFTYLSTRVKND